VRVARAAARLRPRPARIAAGTLPSATRTPTMTDAPVPAGPRRRERGRAPRSTGPQLAPLPRLANPWAPLEILSAEQVERILSAAFRVLEEAGLEIRSEAARAVYRRAGALTDEGSQIVRLGRDLIEAQLAHAPERFVLHARNAARHLHVGDNVVNFGPVTGAPHIRDLEGGRRYGDLEAFRNLLKLTHVLGVLHWQGGIVVEPVDVPVPTRHLLAYQAHIECADTVWAARGIGGVQAEDAIAMSAIEHGCSIEALAARPTLMTVTNVNSPRRVDAEILDNVMTMAQHGQCVVITPFTLMGAMAPVTLAGALVQQTAEALGVVALCQLTRPGTPCVMGGFTSNVDMRTGSPAFGTPEYVHAVLAGAQLGRRLKLPVRSSAVNASPTVDAQSTYETAFSLQAAILSHSHLINHAAGWLEGGLSASYEKFVVDAELLRAWAEILKPVRFNDEDLAVETIKDIAAGGHFFGAAHTLARYESAFYRPLLSDWSNFESWKEAGAHDATERATGIWKKLLADYVPPPLDPAVREAIGDYVARRTREIGNAG
jgi:trimethylamine---corrinoid protein Co-methyltransferase